MVRFAVTLPWWGYVFVFAGASALAWLTYARLGLGLPAGRRAALTALRALTLLLLAAMLLRPVQIVPAAAARDALVPILVDTSRSMRLPDGDGSRLDAARAIAADLQARLAGQFQVELLSFGETVNRAEAGDLAATARRSDLSGALETLADRYRGQPVAGLVVVSDGGDTAGREAGGRAAGTLGPVFTVGVGGGDAVQDREVVTLAAGDPAMTESSIDLSVSAVAPGFGTAPIELRLTANGRPIEVRRVTPAADGAPIHASFTVSPDRDAPTVYVVEIPAVDGELTTENNVRRVLVPPQGRPRRVLIVEGAPGFEHTFLKRALGRDPGLELDSVVRKGRDDDGRDTFFVQAAASRAAWLAEGYPSTRDQLFAYDAIVFGNIEGDFFSRDQLEMTADFVGTRGGGLLVLGARSFERTGLSGTPLAEVLPVDLTDRRADLAHVSAEGGTPDPNALALTSDGATHPATRLAVTLAESRRRWAALPPLASVSEIGGPRPGAQVLAVTASAGGRLRPLLAAQRYGEGRSLVFAGEASWRWRMLLPARDTTHEMVWRQMTRWLAAGASAPVTLVTPDVSLPGTTEALQVIVRDEAFAPIGDAEVRLRLTGPGGDTRDVTAALADPRAGRYSASARFEDAGVYRVEADVRRGGSTLAAVTRPILVGGADLEMAEPRLNDEVLRRVAEGTGGRYLERDALAELPALLASTDPEPGPPEVRDLWHHGLVLAILVALLAAEWVLRRRSGLA